MPKQKGKNTDAQQKGEYWVIVENILLWPAVDLGHHYFYGVNNSYLRNPQCPVPKVHSQPSPNVVPPNKIIVVVKF
jgi:hypothetical protein